MRMTRILTGLTIVLASGTVAMAYVGTYTPGAGINLTPHDLGTVHNGMNYTAVPADPVGGRICIFCHAPHNTYKLDPANGGPPLGTGSGPTAPVEYTYLPLWNHTLPAVVPYEMYENGPGAPVSGPKAAQSIPLMTQPGSVSLLCLSCHDGSIAVNEYGNTSQPPASQSTGVTTMAAGYQIGMDKYLGNHHPITFDYDIVWGADNEIRDPDTAFMTPATSVRDHLYGNGAGTNSYLECASCHSVHNTGNGGEMLLWRSDINSELCLTCHAKGDYTAP